LREFSRLLSPVSIIGANEEAFRHRLSDAPWIAVFVNFMGYATALIVVRHLCFKYADRLLGRSETTPPAGAQQSGNSTINVWETQAITAHVSGDRG
jgi:hypothetical protein